MNKSKGCEIPYSSLSLGKHQFEYLIEDSFFEQFVIPSFREANLLVKTEIDKKSSLFLIHFSIAGTVRTSCDRCGDDFNLEVWDEVHLTGKLTDPDKIESLNENDDEVIYFDKTNNNINLSEYIYEQIILCMPIQFIHPDKKNGESGCNAQAINLLNALQSQSEQTLVTKQNKSQEKQDTNPFSLQEQLKKIKTK
jgi:uncharacterized metal-binding protein YceD (DUF177 family)